MARTAAGVDGCFDRHARSHQGTKRDVMVEHDLHGDTLDHLGEVARGVVRREQGEGAARSRRPALDMTRDTEIGECIDDDASRLPRADIGHLGFLVIGVYPDVRQRYDVDYMRT